MKKSSAHLWGLCCVTAECAWIIREPQSNKQKGWCLGGRGAFVKRVLSAHAVQYFSMNDTDMSTASFTLLTSDTYLEFHKSAFHMTPNKMMGMESVKCVMNNRKRDACIID